MKKHASPDELASLALGALRTRKATRIESHVVSCEYCTGLRQDLDVVPAILASAAYPPMPATLASRVEVAISVESRQRLSFTPATEPDRAALPTRRRRSLSPPGWRLPGLSVRATRLVAAAGAVVVVAVGSYLAVGNTSGSGAKSSGASVAAPASPRQVALGPEVTYGQPNALHTVHTVHSSANFDAAHLKTEAVDAVHAAEARGASATAPPSGTASASAAQPNHAAARVAGPNSPSLGQLSGCLTGLALTRTILLVDLARYEGRPATIIVAAATAVRQIDVWVVGNSCSATKTDVLAHTVLGHL